GEVLACHVVACIAGSCANLTNWFATQRGFVTESDLGTRIDPRPGGRESQAIQKVGPARLTPRGSTSKSKHPRAMLRPLFTGIKAVGRVIEAPPRNAKATGPRKRRA